MTVPRLLLVSSFAVILGSCVTNKKFTLLQKKSVREHRTPTDSVVREYPTVQVDYKIQPEDIISVRFESLTAKDYDFLNLNQSSQSGTTNIAQGNALLIGELVDHAGEIPLPYFGKTKVGGLTVFEAQEKLTGLVKPYLDQPVVKVRLLNFRFTILGEVNREGTITVSNNRVSLLEAIGLAGGITDLADRDHIKLIRNKDGKSEIQYINLLTEDFIQSPYYYINQNDILVVPPLRQRPFRKYFGPNLALVASTLSLLLLTANLVLLNNNN